MARRSYLRLTVDEALCAIDMVTLLDPSDPEVSAAADAARTILTRLRATPFIERLEAAQGAPGLGPQARARAGRRSVERLAKV